MKTNGSYVLIGVITGVHGVKGAVKIRSFSESLDIFRPGQLLHIRKEGQEKSAAVLWAKHHRQSVIMALNGISTRDAALDLAGGDLYIPRRQLPDLEPDVYYWADLIGLEVLSENGNRLGRLESIFPTGSNDVYVVRNGEREWLIPAIASVVMKIDLEACAMRVKLPEGLDAGEPCFS